MAGVRGINSGSTSFRYPEWDADFFYPRGSVVTIIHSGTNRLEHYIARNDVNPSSTSPENDSTNWQSFLLNSDSDIDNIANRLHNDSDFINGLPVTEEDKNDIYTRLDEDSDLISGLMGDKSHAVFNGRIAGDRDEPSSNHPNPGPTFRLDIDHTSGFTYEIVSASVKDIDSEVGSHAGASFNTPSITTGNQNVEVTTDSGFVGTGTLEVHVQSHNVSTGTNDSEIYETSITAYRTYYIGFATAEPTGFVNNTSLTSQNIRLANGYTRTLTPGITDLGVALPAAGTTSWFIINVPSDYSSQPRFEAGGLIIEPDEHTQGQYTSYIIPFKRRTIIEVFE